MKESDSKKNKKTDPVPRMKQRDSVNANKVLNDSAANKKTKKYRFFTPTRPLQDDDKSEPYGFSQDSFGYSILNFLNAPFRFINKTLFSTISSKKKNKKYCQNNNLGDGSEENDIWVQNQEFRENLKNFASKTAEDIMIPRSDIFAVSNDYSLEELCKVISSNNHTRTLVYKEDLDNIIGFIHIKDLFKIVTKDKKYNLSNVLRKHIVCPCSMKLINLFKQMQDERVHIAVVVDEYGGTDGLITIEDVIEEIVGRIDDEHDHDLESDDFKLVKPGVMIANARLEIEEIEEMLKCRLKGEEDDFDTIGGLVIARSGNIPSKGDVININEQITIEVIDATPRSIKQLKIIFKL